MIQKLLDKQFVKFLIVGVLNTVVGAGIMFLLYNAAHCSYWFSTAANYVVGGVVSFILNRHFTFQNHDSLKRTVPRFALNVAVCYVIAYAIAKPLMKMALTGVPVVLQENAAMLTGMVLYTLLNYVGQRFFAFGGQKKK